MKVSFFKGIRDTSPFQIKDVCYYLDRIRNGKSKTAVSNLRLETDSDKKKAIKQNLPVVCFGGEFVKRGNKYLKKSSGLLVLDFDKLTDPIEFKENISKRDFVFSAWISPSGDGVKVLVKIPNVDNDEQYKQFYNQINKEFPEADNSGKDIARACFESFDENIYVNIEAENYSINYEDVIFVEPDYNAGSVTNIPVTDQDEIANKLMFGFKKYYDPKQRNNSLFKLACSFNSFGVDKITCVTYLESYQQNDFKTDEIKNLISSAYKKSAEFNTKRFENKSKKQKLQNLVLSGKKDSEIKEEFEEIKEEDLHKEIENIRESMSLESFWRFNRDGRIEILPYRFKLYLESLKFYKYYPVENTKTFILITKKDNFINNISEFQIKDKVMTDLIDRNEINVFDTVADRSKLFTPQYLSMLDTADVTMEKDGSDFAMIYYKNCAVKVFHDFVEVFQYEELSGYVWENQIINRNFVKADHHESMFRSFVWFIAGQEVERYNTMKSVIGYCLHSHKTSANNKAIILNDETISDTPNGGSGKGILINSINHMKKVSTIDGKTFDFNKAFPYQTVSTDCQLLAFDDVKRNFEFERLFSLITEGLTIEYKGKDAIKLPVKDSPKILISTNYTIKSDGGSFQRRMFEVELSSYFGINHSPIDEFGCMLFEDWDDEEWARFDQFMINCLQYYLENGLVACELKNLNLRKFINTTCQEFYDWTIDGNLKTDTRLIKNDTYDAFFNEYSDLKFLNKRLFNKWVAKYAEYNKLIVEDGNSNGKRYWVFKTDKDSEVKEDELNNEAPF
jgi:hypothetical protein